MTVHLGQRFDDALVFAARTHRDQRRKGSEVPYVGHLLGVASLVIENGGDEDQAVAALLHDAVEDQGGPAMATAIRERFGDRVGDIVADLTDTDETPKPPWAARKAAYLEHLETAPTDSLLVSLADKLYNARAILRDHLTHGPAVWDRFSAERDQTIWYYRSLAGVFVRRQPGPMADELVEIVQRLVALADDEDRGASVD